MEGGICINIGSLTFDSDSGNGGYVKAFIS